MNKVTFKDRTLKLIQVASSGVEYALLNDKYEALHQQFFCKDYLTDILWCEKNNEYSQEVYGFKYNKNDFKLFENKDLYIALTNTTKNIVKEEYITKLQKFLNEAEELLKFKPSKVELFENAIVVKFSNEWIQQPYLLSIYSLFLRIGLHYDNKGFLDFIYTNYVQVVDSADRGMLPMCKNKFKAIFEDGILPNIEYKSIYSMGNMHINGGIISTDSNLFKIKKEVLV